MSLTVEFSALAQQMMHRALQLAKQAAGAGEVPVGAVVYTAAGDVLGEGHNETITSCDASAHAEVVALRRACVAKGNYRLPDLHLAVTLEPCPMCAGAILQARLASVVYATADPKTGACGSVVDLFSDAMLNHQTDCRGGLFASEAAALLEEFFRARR